MPTARKITLCTLAIALFGAAPPVRAELPDGSSLLRDAGLSAAEIQQVQSGQLVYHALPPTSDRELTTGLAFEVPVPPGELVKDARRDLLDQVDPDLIARGDISKPAAVADFAKLVLKPAEVEAYRKAAPGTDLNLSKQEIASFGKLGADASAQALNEAVRAALVARVEAYRARGLDGLANYAREGKPRSPAQEIRNASKGAGLLAKYAPQAHAYLASYPKGKPAGTEELFRWTHFVAHGEPTLSLNHLLLIPDGDAWILVKRQFYVSTGYNTEQALAAFLPSKQGAVVAYATRSSTDQVEGFGGSAKRSIGSKLLSSQLETMFEKARKKVE